MSEKKYDFRKFLDEIHRPGRRDIQAIPSEHEFAIDANWCITLENSSDSMIYRAAEDLQNYLRISMDLLLPMRLSPQAESHAIHFTAKGEGKPRGFHFSAEPDRITICGNDPAGTLQGAIYLEELFSLREAPFLCSSEEDREPLFSPRMVHSGWGLDQFPDSHLDAILHAGFDSILIFVKNVDLTTHGIMDFNDLIRRAEKFSLGVYFYSYLPSYKHPDEPDAEEFFERNYGRIFRECPGARGLIIVGESAQFPTHDPDCSGKKAHDTSGIADPRPCAGFWPANDYPQWLNAVKRAVRRYQPDADIVFWTYNWGNTPEKNRLDLIRNLPKDITLQATFEMFEKIRYPRHTMVQPDYSITFPGPGSYFRSEAQAAKESGLRLYTMSNTGGMTWDFGVVPYIPVPQQWFRRFRALQQGAEKWGLSGLMDSHHYGWYPSPVAECAKWCFWTPSPDPAEIFAGILKRDFGSAAAESARQAYQSWSDAMNSYTPGFDDQSGPLRCGPSYPFILHPILYPHVEQTMEFPTTEQSAVGSSWIRTFYQPEAVYQQSWIGRRIHEDIEIMGRALQLWLQGNEFMKQALTMVPANKKPHAEKLAGVGFFCSHAFRTMLNTKKWWLLNKQLEIEYDETKARELLDQMSALIDEEHRNVEETLPLTEADSRLGWEPSMDYICDPEHLNWKLQQLENLKNNTLRIYRQSIALRPEMKR